MMETGSRKSGSEARQPKITGDIGQGAKQSLAMDFKDIDDAPAETLNRILWWDSKGWNTPYPKR